MSEIVSELAPNGVRPATSGGSAPARPMISNAVTVGGSRTEIAAPEVAAPNASAPTTENQVTQGGQRLGARLKPSTIALIEGTNQPTTASTVAPIVSPPAAAEQAPASPPATPSAAATAAPVATPPAPEVKPAVEDHAAAIERLSTKNREIVAEMEKLKSGGSKRAEPDARAKSLDEIERMFGDNPVAAIRKLAALHHNVADPASKDIDAEMSGIYQDLTERELNVPLDPATKAQRESARTRKLLEREQRERRAEQEAASKPAPEDPEAKMFADHSTIIGTHLSSKQPDGKTVADAYPLTMKFAERLHGNKPSDLILRAIRSGFATGELDPKANDDVLITQAAKKLEAHYQALADSFVEARQPSTAPPTTADATAPKVEAQPQASRTITNASASVAPATPPAKPEPAATKPKYRNEAERRKAIVSARMGDS